MMVFLYPWEDFEKDIILKGEKFYIYGAGKVYEKIIHAVHEKVIAVIDKEHSKKKQYYDVPVIAPQDVSQVGETEMNILCCLYPNEQYYDRTLEVRDYFQNLGFMKVCFYMLDYIRIAKTGVVYWNGRKLLVDNLQYLTNDVDVPGHLPNAYSCIDSFSPAYIKKLYEEPAYYIVSKGKIYYPDFNNGLIIHENGKKKTFRAKSDSEYANTIWIFGDSRVSGMLIDNYHTISGILQIKMDESNLPYKVENCGIPGREIERMVLQIRESSICEGDMVILGTGFYEYQGDAVQNVLVWNEFIHEAAEFCASRKSRFLYINLPTLLEMNSMTDEEVEVLETFNTTEFTEYSKNKVEGFNEIISCFCASHGIIYKNFAVCFQTRYEYGTCFINLHHYGPNGNRLIADSIFEYITILMFLEKVDYKAVKNAALAKRCALETKKKEMDIDTEIKEYLESIREKTAYDSSKGKTGCIVMNANPFTRGHMYLVRKSMQYVDCLIVMVVQEDASYFSFKDRLNMVKDNLEGLDNIVVVSSGRFCISKATFPEYFKKENIQGEKVNSAEDLLIFATKIAPALNIEMRFVGEEPSDTITRQYNEQMKQILPAHGIEVIEVPRAEEKGVPVSASEVRRHWSGRDWEKVRALVTEPTYHYLRKMKEQSVMGGRQ